MNHRPIPGNFPVWHRLFTDIPRPVCQQNFHHLRAGVNGRGIVCFKAWFRQVSATVLSQTCSSRWLLYNGLISYCAHKVTEQQADCAPVSYS